MVREAKASATLKENGFINNLKDASTLIQDSFLDNIAQGHIRGLEKALGLKKKKAAESNSPKKQSGGKLYRLQVSAFTNKGNTEKLADELKKKGYSTYIIEQ